MKIKIYLIIIAAAFAIGVFTVVLSGVLVRQVMEGAKPNVTININQPKGNTNLEQVQNILQTLLNSTSAKSPSPSSPEPPVEEEKPAPRSRKSGTNNRRR